jgi:hypothetical protein
MLMRMLIIGAPLLWLTLTVVVLAACRAAGRADARRASALTPEASRTPR